MLTNESDTNVLQKQCTKGTFSRQAVAAAACLALLLLLAACFGDAAGDPPDEAAGGPQKIEGATEIVKFDPAAIALGNDAVTGMCAASTIVPGTYRCEWDGGAAEPCFAAGGARLVCRPNPVAGSYETLVSTERAPAPLPAPPLDQQVEFFVELADGQTCMLRVTPEPVMLDGTPAVYDCDRSFTYLLALDTSAPTWQVAPITLDTATGQTTAAAPLAVLRAWIP